MTENNTDTDETYQVEELPELWREAAEHYRHRASSSTYRRCADQLERCLQTDSNRSSTDEG